MLRGMRIASILLLSVACSGGEPDESADPPDDFDPDLAAALERALSEGRAAIDAPGAALAVRLADGTVWSGAAGVADLATDVPTRVDHRFRIGSITKTFVASIALLLRDEGRLELDVPVDTYVSDVPFGDLKDHT